ncbi:hypothetical protein [Cryptosporangium sp. NPDC051539]|uniref:hypothetical protein n=1 Tax=Cryptosporangium sp. NPDC051539 TaxID=3363962 RepID=UPI00379923E9
MTDTAVPARPEAGRSARWPLTLYGVGLVANGFPGLAAFSLVTGVVFLAFFLALAASGGTAWALLGFTVAVVLASAWLSVVSLHYR